MGRYKLFLCVASPGEIVQFIALKIIGDALKHYVHHQILFLFRLTNLIDRWALPLSPDGSNAGIDHLFSAHSTRCSSASKPDKISILI